MALAWAANRPARGTERRCRQAFRRSDFAPLLDTPCDVVADADTFEHDGWNTRRLPLEMLLGIVLFAPMAVGINWLEQLLLGLGLSKPPESSPGFLQPIGHVESSLWPALVLVVVVAIAEDTICRG